MLKTSHGIAGFGFVVAWCNLLQAAVPGSGEADRRLESRFMESVVYKIHLKGERIQMASVAGVVTLTGQVTNPSAKSLALELLMVLPGVQRVDNRLRVVLEGGERGDAWIRSKVKSLLAIHRRGKGPDAEVDFRGGVLTLSGTAENEDQIAMASAYAADVDGVERVIHEIQVAPFSTGTTEPLVGEVDDPSITAQVRVALRMHHSTSRLHPQVQTIHGMVTVGGIAQSTGEIERVSWVVSDIRGVKGLLNRMTVMPLAGAKVRPSPVGGLRVVIGSK